MTLWACFVADRLSASLTPPSYLFCYTAASVGVVSHSGLVSPAHSVRLQQVAQSMTLNQLMSGSQTGNFITLTGKVSSLPYKLIWAMPRMLQHSVDSTP